MISDKLRLASQYRVPVFKRGAVLQAKKDELEEFMLVSAFHGGELHEERLGLYAELEPLKRRWENLQGWEMHRRNKTEAGVNDAKRQMEPRLHAQISDLGWKIRRLSEEIDRLERDAGQVSRAYTILTSG